MTSDSYGMWQVSIQKVYINTYLLYTYIYIYNYGHLPVISGYKWDYTLYKWGYKYL